MPQVTPFLTTTIAAIESLEAERANLAETIKDDLDRLKTAGYDTKIVRKVLALRRKNRAEVEAEQHKIDELLLQLEGTHGSTPGSN